MKTVWLQMMPEFEMWTPPPLRVELRLMNWESEIITSVGWLSLTMSSYLPSLMFVSLSISIIFVPVGDCVGVFVGVGIGDCAGVGD